MQSFLLLLVIAVFGSVTGFQQRPSFSYQRRSQLSAGLLDLFKGGEKSAPTAATGTSKKTITVDFKAEKKDVVSVQAEIGRPLPAIARDAGVEIRYQCGKGECNTCEVNVNGKFVKSCQTVTGPENMRVVIREYKGKDENVKKPAFFSPQSLADGFANNVIGMVGFAQEGAKVDGAFQERMERERLLLEKVAAKKAAAEAAKKK